MAPCRQSLFVVGEGFVVASWWWVVRCGRSSIVGDGWWDVGSHQSLGWVLGHVRRLVDRWDLRIEGWGAYLNNRKWQTFTVHRSHCHVACQRCGSQTMQHVCAALSNWPCGHSFRCWHGNPTLNIMLGPAVVVVGGWQSFSVVAVTWSWWWRCWNGGDEARVWWGDSGWALRRMVVVVEEENDGLMMPKLNIGICRHSIWVSAVVRFV